MPELAKAYVQIVPTMSESGGGSLTQLFNSSGVSSQADSAGKSVGGSFLGGLGGAISAGAGAVIGGIAAVGGAFTDAIGNVASYGDSIDKMSQKMGMSAQAYQEWDAVMQHSGTSMETMKAGMKTLANAVANGNEAFQKIGLTQEQIASMSQEELFGATIKGLQNVDNETERTYLAGQLLGRGATELGALLNTSAEDTDKMRQRVHELGGVMSNEAVKAAAAYQDSLQDMKTAFTGLKNNMLAEFLPSIKSVMDGLAEIFTGNSEQGIGMISKGVNGMMRKIGEAIPKLAQIATQIIASLAQTFVANLPQIIGMGYSIIGTLAQSINTNLPLIWQAIQGIFTSIGTAFTTYGPTMMQEGFNLLTNLALGIVSNFPTVLGAISQGVSQAFGLLDGNMPGFLDKGIQAIGQIANGILQNLPSVITSLGNMASSALAFLLQNMPMFLQKGVELIGNIASGIVQNLPAIVTAIAQVIVRLIQTLLQNMPQFLQKGIELIGKVASGIVQAIPNVVSAMKSAAQGAFNAFKEINWLELGSNVISGIVSGITGAAGALFDSLKNLASNALNAAKDALKVGSPSRLFRDEVGRWIPRGISVGIEDTVPEVEATLSGAARRLVDAANVSGFTPAAVPTQNNRLTRDDILLIAEAVRAGMEDITVNTTISEKSFKRGLTGMGVRFA